MADSIFGKIARGELKADVVYEDDLALAFRDISPQAPTHILVIPRKPIPRLYAAGDISSIFGHLYLEAGNVTECFVGGKIAGANAAKEKPWDA